MSRIVLLFGVPDIAMRYSKRSTSFLIALLRWLLWFLYAVNSSITNVSNRLSLVWFLSSHLTASWLVMTMSSSPENAFSRFLAYATAYVNCGVNFSMSSAHEASRMDNGARTKVRDPRLVMASRTDRVFPVPGSGVISHRGFFSMCAVVAL